MAEDLNRIRRSLTLVERSLNTIKSKWIPKDKLKPGQKNPPELEKQINLLEQRKYELKGMLRNALKEMVSSKMEASGLGAPEPSMAKPSEGTKEEISSTQKPSNYEEIEAHAEEEKVKTEKELSEDLEEKEEEVLSEQEKLARAQREEIEERREREKNEEREKEKWGRAKRVWGKTKKTAKVAHGVVTLGSGWIGFFLFSSLIIWLLDSSFKYIGPVEFSFVLKDMWNMAGWSVFMIVMVVHIARKWGELNWGEVATYAIAILTLAFVALTGTLNWLGAIHLVYIIFFWLFVIRNEEDQVTSNILLSAIIIIDFYRYVILKAFLPMDWVVRIMVVPILLIGTIAYLGKKFPENRMAQFAFWIMVIVIIALNGQRLVLASKAIIATDEGISVIGPLEVLKGMWGGVKGFYADIQKGYESQMEYATGGYYKGQVEENKDEQLGVYLENVEAADTKFLRDEEVTIWGDLKARTLDEPIYVRMSCGSDGVKGEIVPEKLGNMEGGYEIQRLEEIGFECRFKPNELKDGTNNINITAEFNFKTLAFLKTYFMDIERIRALRRENIDPLEQYGIIDKTPTAVYTNGPVRLGMGTIDPPLGLNYQNNTYSFIGVTVEGQWAGKIKNITGLEIQVPSVLKVEGGPELFCKGDFKKTMENEEGYAIYEMTEEAIKGIKTPIEQFRSWRCSITVPRANEVLGKTPVTTYYYRASVEYVYEIEKSISVYVQPSPKEEKSTGTG